MTDGMSQRERTDLAALVRRREKVAKTAALQRKAELLADVEEQLAATYKRNAEHWAEVTAAADQAVADADAEIARRCQALGIPEAFRPSLHLGWYNRGESADAQRRAELRRVAVTRLDAMEKAARAEIERRSVNVQTQLLAGGLESAAAQAFLETMPTADQLMPPLALAELEASVPLTAGRAALYG